MSVLSKIFSISNTSVINESVYEALFKEYYAPLCRLVMRILHDKELTEDTVQDVFIKLWEKRREIKIEVSLKSYLYRAAIHQAYTVVEKNKRYKKVEMDTAEDVQSSMSTPIELMGAEETEKRIVAILEELPEGCREVFMLSRYEEMSYKQIAEMVGISIKTVENQMGKALKIFREKLNHST